MRMVSVYRRGKDALKGRLRRWLQGGTASSKIFRPGIGFATELAARLPWIGAHFGRWAGLIRAVQGEHHRAVLLYREAIDGGLDRYPSLHYDLGNSLLKTGDGKQAEVSFRLAMGLAPMECWPVHGLVQSLLQQGEPIRLVDELLKVAESLPEREIVQLPFPTYLGPQVFLDTGLSGRLERFVAKHPDAMHAVVLLAQVESLRSNAEAASKLFRSAGRLWYAQDGVVDVGGESASPRFMILGQAKAGTSALFQYLSMHPSMVAPLTKEPHYWSKNYHLGSQWYRSQFPCLSHEPELFTGEGSVTSLVHPKAPARVAQDLPQAKFIVLLREPVERSYSHYWMYRRLKIESNSFEDAIAEELRRYRVAPTGTLEEWNVDVDKGYLVESCALPFLRRWLEYFPPEQFLILRNEQMKRDLPGTLRQVCRFLGVREYVPGVLERHNEGRYAPMKTETKEMLTDWFAPHQKELEEFMKSTWGC